MQVTPGSRYFGCWGRSVSAGVGNPSVWGTLSPGLGDRSGSALLGWGAPEQKTSHPGRSPPETPLLELLAAREAVTELLPSRGSLGGSP